MKGGHDTNLTAATNIGGVEARLAALWRSRALSLVTWFAGQGLAHGDAEKTFFHITFNI